MDVAVGFTTVLSAAIKRSSDLIIIDSFTTKKQTAMPESIAAAYTTATNLANTLYRLSLFSDPTIELSVQSVIAYPGIEDEIQEVFQQRINIANDRAKQNRDELLEILDQLNSQFANLITVLYAEEIGICLDEAMLKFYEWEELRLGNPLTIGKTVREPLLAVRSQLMTWAGLLYNAACRDTGVIGSIENKTLRDIQADCPFDEQQYQRLTERIKLESKIVSKVAEERHATESRKKATIRPYDPNTDQGKFLAEYEKWKSGFKKRLGPKDWLRERATWSSKAKAYFSKLCGVKDREELAILENAIASERRQRKRVNEGASEK